MDTYFPGNGFAGNVDSLNILGKFFAEGQMERDMNLFVDDNGKAYHIYSSEYNASIQIAELTDDYLGHSGKYVRALVGRPGWQRVVAYYEATKGIPMHYSHKMAFKDNIKIVSKKDGNYVNEKGNFGTNAYYYSWNTYTFHCLEGENLFAIQKQMAILISVVLSGQI